MPTTILKPHNWHQGTSRYVNAPLLLPRPQKTVPSFAFIEEYIRLMDGEMTSESRCAHLIFVVNNLFRPFETFVDATGFSEQQPIADEIQILYEGAIAIAYVSGFVPAVVDASPTASCMCTRCNV